ncbi:MAG: prealbumin-like fold domain-containing protein, partial [Candidatus Acidiferrales bacterium]
GTTINFKLVNSLGATAEFQPDPPGGDEFQCLTSGGTGSCQSTIVSPTTGLVTVAARSVILVEGVEFKLQTNGVGNNSAPATKTYVDAKISIGDDDTNPIGEPHIFTANVMIDAGDGSGFVNAPDGTTINFKLINSLGATAEFQPDPPGGDEFQCLTAGGTGSCQSTINSPTPGTVTVAARSVISVGGVQFQLATNGVGNNSEPAVKIYVAGNIIVIKTCEPEFDEQLFTFAGPGAINEAQLACFTNGNTNQVDSGPLAPGNYEVSEIVPAGWDLDSITCDDDDNSGGLVDIPAVDLVLDANETITCTFHNIKQAFIKIRKIAVGRSATFSYTSSPALPDPMAATGIGGTGAAFTIQTQPFPDPNNCPSSGAALPGFDFDTADCKNEAMFNDVAPGVYRVSETQPNADTWQAIAISCDDGTIGTLSPDTEGGNNGGFVDIDVSPGETIICTFLDRWGGKIIVEKQTIPDGAAGDFDFTHNLTNGFSDLPNAFPLSDGESNRSLWQIPGSYHIEESSIATGFDFTSVVCTIEMDTATPANVGMTVGTPDAGTGIDVPLEGGQIIRCVWTNTQRGTIEICKQILFGDITSQFPFLTTGDGYDGFTLGHDQCDTQTLPPGDYSATENVAVVPPAGTWLINALTDPAITCTADAGSSFAINGAAADTDAFESGDDTVNISLGAAGDVSCTFRNRLGGFIRIIKACDPEVDPSNSVFTFDTDFVRTDGTHPQDDIALMCGQNHLSLWQPVLDAVNGTNYTITEDPTPMGWTLTGITCVVESGPGVGQPVGTPNSPSVTVPLMGGQVIACTFTNTMEQNEGCTPGYWKNHTGLGPQGNAWPPSGHLPGDALNSVWTIPACVDTADPKIDDATLLQALSFKGGSGIGGGARNLLRAAVAALLNASHPDVNYPRSEADVIADVQAALDSCDRNTMLQLAGELDEDNNLGCPLSNPTTASGDVPMDATPVADIITESSVPASESTPVAATESSFTQPSSEPSPFRLSVSGSGGGISAEEPKPAVEVAKSQITSVTFKDGVLELSGVALNSRTGKPLEGVAGLTLAFYSDKDGAPVWLDIHNVELDSNGNYTLRLTLPEGVLQLEPSWLGVQVQGQAEQPRVSLR